MAGATDRQSEEAKKEGAPELLSSCSVVSLRSQEALAAWA